MMVTVVPSTTEAPEGKLTEAELWFDKGLSLGLKVVGCVVLEN